MHELVLAFLIVNNNLNYLHIRNFRLYNYREETRISTNQSNIDGSYAVCMGTYKIQRSCWGHTRYKGHAGSFFLEDYITLSMPDPT